MATTSVTISAECNGKPLSVLGNLIAIRQRAMRETTAQSVTATAINILSSARAATIVAKASSAKSGFVSSKASGVVAGFKTAPGTRKGRRVIRAEGGHEMTGVATVNLAGNYVKGESVGVYVVVFKYHKFRRKGESYDRFYVLAKNEKDARNWAEKKLAKYIRMYSGTAKWVLGQAMSRVSNKGYASSEQIEKAAQRVGLGALSVVVVADGYNSGEYRVTVADDLRYAKLALRGGPSAMDAIMMKAANRTAGIINRQIRELRFDGELMQTPFPELKGEKI